MLKMSFVTVHILLHRRRKEVWDGAKPQGFWGTEVPSGVQGRSPGRGSGVAEEFLSSYKQILCILVVFHTFSPIYAYVLSVLAGIIPLSLRNGGHLIPFAPLSASGGQLPPLPPAPPSMAVLLKHLKSARDSLLA